MLDFFDIVIFEYGDGLKFKVENIIWCLTTLLGTYFFTNIVLLFVKGIYKMRNVSRSAQFSINQIIRYFIFTIGFLMAIQALGINLGIILGASAALLVGVGLGLQQTFNDLISGIILLFDGSVDVDDIIKVEGMVGRVEAIGIRTTRVLTRENSTVMVPNSKLMNNNLVNWTHFDNKMRFDIKVGVAYGSDVDQVTKLLIKAATDNKHVLLHPAPFVRFQAFGESSLNFELYYWTTKLFEELDVKSDLHYSINHLFTENKISIPFPQRVVWSGGPKV